jgi:hypothetical protein
MNRDAAGTTDATFQPFRYQTGKPSQRRHGPRGYRDYRDYKPWLRDEYVFRCVYCLFRERWNRDGHKSFSIDHVKPKSLFRLLTCRYDNLVYACTACNRTKRAYRLLNPTRAALGNHIRVENDGSIEALSRRGKDLIDALQLNEQEITEKRLGYLLIVRAMQKYPDDPVIARIFDSYFSYPSPENLPDLTSVKQPPRNACPGSFQNSFHHRSVHGKLERYY